jgi:cytochrome c-type biogenesis protein CcmF
MTADTGNLSLLMAMLAAAGALFCSALAVKSDNRQVLTWARRLIYVFGTMVVLGSWVLLSALINSDFRNAYVASYTERALPTGYKVAAFWAGQEGSLMLWALLLAGMSAVAVYTYRNREVVEQAVMIRILALVCGFFAALMLFAANPFVQLAGEAADGHGLNPLLQDPYMIIHPPLLFVGYAGYTIPWAMLLAALIAGRKDNQWIGATRIWLIVSWLFLTVGIILGAKWAYIELGWGGYWAWDPVENASLLPWLTGTALLHSVMVQQHRGMFKAWNASLIAVTFLLCIFGTYLTRSGVVQSVHSFGESLIGTFFLAFLGLCVLISIGVLAWRRGLLKSENIVQGMFTREGAFLAVNVLLVLITLTTLVGTIFPLISGVVMPEPVSVGPAFYNKVVLPLGLALLAVMSVGPLLTYGKDAGQVLARGLVVPASAGAIVLVVSLVMGLSDIWALVCVLITTVAIFSVGVGVSRAVKQRRQIEDEGPLAATIRVIDSNHRRYGGQFVHLGMIMFMVGVAGSSLFGVTENFKLTPGESASISGYTVTFNGLHQNRYANYSAVEAHVDLTGPGGDQAQTLLPQMRFYDKSEQPSSQVALKSSLMRDTYVTLAGWDDDGQRVAIQVIINPLVAWIWIGGIAMTLGAIFCLMPRLIKQAHAEAAQVPAIGKPTKLKAATIPLALAGEGRCGSDASVSTNINTLKPELTK